MKVGLSLQEALRPQSLDEVIGQDDVKPIIRKYIDQERQQWLFHGPTGTGKTSLAHIVARGLGAEEIWERNAATLSSSDIEELIGDAQQYPMHGKYRAIILDEAQALSPAARTVLLKPLEHSDSINVWILCSMEADSKLHRPLQDRCAYFRLVGMGPKERKALVSRAAEYLEFTKDTKPFLQQLEARAVFSARDILSSFEKHANGMRAEDAVG